MRYIYIRKKDLGNWEKKRVKKAGYCRNRLDSWRGREERRKMKVRMKESSSRVGEGARGDDDGR